MHTHTKSEVSRSRLSNVRGQIDIQTHMHTHRHKQTRPNALPAALTAGKNTKYTYICWIIREVMFSAVWMNTWTQQWLSDDSRSRQAPSNHVGRRTAIVSVDSETSFAETDSQNSSRRSWQNWSHVWNSPIDFTPSSIATSLNCQSYAIQFNYLSTS